MAEARMYQALDIVFYYLSDNDLFKAASICRTWYDMVHYERLSRKYFTYTVDDLKKNYKLHYIFNNKLQINQGNCAHRLQLFFTNCKKSVILDEGHLCQNMKFKSYTVIMKSNNNAVSIEDVNSFFPFSLLAQVSAEIKMYTYILPFRRKRMYGSILHNTYGSDIKPTERLINDLKMSFTMSDKRLKSSIMFILCKEKAFSLLLAWFNDLIDSDFNYSNMITWGGTVDELSVCRFSMKKHFCKVESEFVFIYMWDPSMKVYLDFYEEDGQSINSIYPKLQSFREKVQLLYNSVAFVHVSTLNNADNVEEVFEAIKKFFPNVPCFRFYGNYSFGNYTLRDVHRNMATTGFNVLASIMILTSY